MASVRAAAGPSPSAGVIPEAWKCSAPASTADQSSDAGSSRANAEPARSYTTRIVRRAQLLYEIPERGDRLIAATAAELDLPLITRDNTIADAAGVDVIW